MKDLDRTKKYDLSILNNEQLRDVLDWLKENDKGWEHKEIIFFKSSFKVLGYDDTEWMLETDGYNTNALELFDNNDNSVYDDILSLIEKGKQHGLKIVVTFEKL